jgi:uncharacterized membrane protein
MTRKEQNQFILAKIQEKLTDIPNVQATLEQTFMLWFQALAAAGLQQMKPAKTPSDPAGAGGGGGGDAGGGGAAPAAPEGGAE